MAAAAVVTGEDSGSTRGCNRDWHYGELLDCRVMANPCDPNAGEPQGGLGSVIVYDAAQLANFLVAMGMGWVAPLVPKIGGRSYDLADFCAAYDDATAPSTDPSYILNMFSPLNPSGASQQLQWLTGLIDQGIWYASCQCPSGPPTPPSPISQPTGLDLNPPGTDTPPGATCLANGSIFASLDDPGAGQSVFSYPSGLFSPLAGLNVTKVVIEENFTVVSTPFQFVLEYGVGTSSIGFQSLYRRTVTDSVLGNGTWEIAIPPGASVMARKASGWLGSGRAGESSTFKYYCNGTEPTGSPSQCCPTDPNLLSLVQQVLTELTFIETLIPVRPPNYAAGTSHSGVSGDGTIALAATTIAVRVAFTTVPGYIGGVLGTPETRLGLGWVSPVTNEGVEAGLRITRATQVIPLPEATSSLDYTFTPGAVATIDELQAG